IANNHLIDNEMNVKDGLAIDDNKLASKTPVDDYNWACPIYPIDDNKVPP
ncbi:3634_t:CDS:1, partial [Dentiscutata erythropus]